MTGPIILPATKPLPHAHRAEFGAWCADKLREARALNALACVSMPIFISTDSISADDRQRIEQALKSSTRAFPGLLQAAADFEPDPQPWEFNLLQLKANLR